MFPDIDECAGEHGCEYGCNNINGSFECFCETGFELDSTGYACQGQKEHRVATYIPTLSFYTVYIIRIIQKHNFTIIRKKIVLEAMFNTCSCALILNASLIFLFPDVDECAGEHGCEYGCNNINGSFECFCETGFELDSTGYACQGQKEHSRE